jgi:hypothetical protein
VLLIAVTAISSCKQKRPDEGDKETLIKAIDNTKINTKINWVVVLPGLGCHGCIQEAEQFMKDHLKNRDILFVLTKISSLKILQEKIGFKVKGQPNVLIDSNDTFDLLTDNRIYPIIIGIKKGRLLSYAFQSPKNSAAFAKLDQLVAQTK